jgi:LAO/AO transport system kinase
MSLRKSPKRLPLAAYIEGVLARDRVILSRAITLVESKLDSDRELATAMIEELMPHTGQSIRVGITGVPGVGKSTFIERFGMLLCEAGHHLAVLAVDPSSQKSGGSILGDKTRMVQLSHHPSAYIRPTASGAALGGVAIHTRESILLCEAAGFDVIFIETVGVGQSETMVHGMVDFFLLLMLAGAGDELQGIKKGIMEMADAVVINKADGDNLKAAKRAKVDYQNALHLFPLGESNWSPQVLTCSSVEGTGLQEIWQMILKYKEQTQHSSYFLANRKRQNLQWMREAIQFLLQHAFFGREEVKAKAAQLEEQVAQGHMAPTTAAFELMRLFGMS